MELSHRLTVFPLILIFTLCSNLSIYQWTEPRSTVSFHFWWSFNISAWGENFIVWDMTWQHILWFVKFLHNVDIYTFIVYLLEEADHQSSDPRSQITNHRSQYITLKNWNNHIVLIRVIAFTPFLPDEKRGDVSKWRLD